MRRLLLAATLLFCIQATADYSSPQPAPHLSDEQKADFARIYGTPGLPSTGDEYEGHYPHSQNHFGSSTSSQPNVTEQASCGFAFPQNCQMKAGREGSFLSTPHHNVTGSVKAEKRSDGNYVILSSDFSTTAGPALYVVLRDSKDRLRMKLIGKLKSNSGDQEYGAKLSDSDFGSFDEVVIYCVEYNVEFGIASLH